MATRHEDQPPVLPRIMGLLADHRGKLAIVGVAIIVSALLGAVTPFLTRAVFDDALFPKDGSGADLPLLWEIVGAMVAIIVATSLIGIGQTYLTNQIGHSSMAKLRAQLFEHLQRMELAFFTSTKTGSIQSRLANDVGGVRSVLTSTASSILSNSVTVIASFVAMILLSWQLTVLALVMLPAFVVIQRRVGQRRQRLARKTQESLSDMTAITEEALSVSGVLLSKVFNRADRETERYRAANDRQTRLQVKQAMAGQGFFAIVGAFIALTPAIIYLAAGYMMGGASELTAGTLVAFTTLQARLLMPLMSLMRVGLEVQTSLALFRRIFEYLDLQPAIVDRPEAVELPDSGYGRIEFDDVFFRYPTPIELTTPEPPPRGMHTGVGVRSLGMTGGFPGQMAGSASGLARGNGADRRPQQMAATTARESPEDAPESLGERPKRNWALQSVSLSVEPGQLAAFVGPSGAGKTTLCYLVPRLYDVTQGVIRIGDFDVRDIQLGSLTDAVGMVTQDPYLFHASIRANLLYASPDASEDDLVLAASAANIHDRITSFEHGYDTIVGERGFRLSGGEKQRIAIARVLLKDPQILILDEATSALDTASERLVQQSLNTLMAGRTTLAIAHRLSTVQHADVIFVVDDGQIVERGTHDDLLETGGLYARLHAQQFGGGRVEARCSDGVVFSDGVVMPV